MEIQTPKRLWATCMMQDWSSDGICQRHSSGTKLRRGRAIRMRRVGLGQRLRMAWEQRRISSRHCSGIKGQRDRVYELLSSILAKHLRKVLAWVLICARLFGFGAKQPCKGTLRRNAIWVKHSKMDRVWVQIRDSRHIGTEKQRISQMELHVLTWGVVTRQGLECKKMPNGRQLGSGKQKLLALKGKEGEANCSQTLPVSGKTNTNSLTRFSKKF